MLIRDLFDSSRNIERPIEKVITYGSGRLKAEIAEYIVTRSIEGQIETLLRRMQDAMDAAADNEIGVWVSGFYGSGKSSFTKYIGLALDGQTVIDDIPFQKHLQDRLHTPQAKALLSAVSQRFPAAVVMLDLASEMLAGATMLEVSTVLFYKVLQWAGYSENVKLASLERRLEQDGRYDAFKARAGEILEGIPWESVHNDPLVMDEIVPRLAHEFYPQFYSSPTSFTTNIEETFRFEDRRVAEMLDIIRRRSGKEHILFIVDEVGQYVASRLNLILNLQGLAQNLKAIGQGKAWIIATAQQTLTEDDPRAHLNAPELYRLKDRFPIQIDLESSDIREICYKRLLAKSPAGETALGKLFSDHGQSLRHATKLQDAKYYDAELDRETFVNLYPFLPAHFDILLHLLGALAKSTGGIGLRSAIKVIQDILIESEDSRPPVADREVGWLANTVTLFDALDKDIKRAFPSISKSAEKAFIRFPDSDFHQEIAKSIAVLQILGNLPVTVENLAALMHPTVQAPSRLEEIRGAVVAMQKDPLVPLGEKDGSLCFLSEKLLDIEQERADIPVRAMEQRRIFSESLRGALPGPSTRLHNTLAVTSGLKLQSGTLTAAISGEREPVQTVIEFADPSDYETRRAALLDESRQRGSQSTVYLLTRSDPQVDELIGEIYRCQRIAEIHRTDPDQEIREYCAAQLDRSAKLTADLERLLKRTLAQGSFLFRGENTAVAALDADILEAAKKHLGGVASQVFERYGEAAIRVDTDLAEKLLRTANLASVTAKTDPLGLIETSGGKATIKSAAKPLVSIREFLDSRGSIDGKGLIDHFAAAPFGWSPDTLRYLVAVLLLGSGIKLKVSGKEVVVNGPQAIDALKTNKSFGSVGVLLRGDQPAPDVLARAAQRLTELTGDTVLPLEDDICKAASKAFALLQKDFGPLAEKLRALDLPGVARIETLNNDLADLLFADASESPQRLGVPDSLLYGHLVWAREANRVLAQGLEATVRTLKQHLKGIAALPDSGIPGQLRQDTAEDLALATQRLSSDDFFKHGPDLTSQLTGLQSRVRDAVIALAARQKDRLSEGAEDLKRLPDWSILTTEEQGNALDTLEKLLLDPAEDLEGLTQLIAREFDIQNRLSELKSWIARKGEEQRWEHMDPDHGRGDVRYPKLSRSVNVAHVLRTRKEIDDLIRQLQGVREECASYADMEIRIEVQDIGD
ncbi:BREX system P-loop protein BrxC [Methylolobus aquaticus]